MQQVPHIFNIILYRCNLERALHIHTIIYVLTYYYYASTDLGVYFGLNLWFNRTYLCMATRKPTGFGESRL